MAKRARRTWVFYVAGPVALILIGGLGALRPGISLLTWVVRTCALLGYLCAFLAAISTPYMRELVRFFGRPFVKTHHTLSITAVVLIAIHPIAVALSFGSLNVFVPVLDSLIAFLRWGGRVAWYLFGIAALAAWLRSSIKRQWRPIHMLNYLAFLLVTVHATLLGTDFRPTPMKILPVTMAVLVVGIFVLKRTQRRRMRARRR